MAKVIRRRVPFQYQRKRPLLTNTVSLRPRPIVSFLISSARDDMAAIMYPPIAETCYRMGQHLSGLTLQVGATSYTRVEIANSCRLWLQLEGTRKFLEWFHAWRPCWKKKELSNEMSKSTCCTWKVLAGPSLRSDSLHTGTHWSPRGL